MQHMPASGDTRPAISLQAREIARDCMASRARHLDRLIARIYDGALRGHGVTGSQLGLLVAIELSGATSAAVIGRRLDMERSTVSRNLARLVAAGLVDTADGLRITARGTATIRACHPAWRTAQRQATAALGPLRSRLLAHLPGPGPKADRGHQSEVKTKAKTKTKTKTIWKGGHHGEHL
jgi:DNA-binding MarR family transcriptional regulator